MAEKCVIHTPNEWNGFTVVLVYSSCEYIKILEFKLLFKGGGHYNITQARNLTRGRIVQRGMKETLHVQQCTKLG
jgi:hypothetical protein